MMLDTNEIATPDPDTTAHPVAQLAQAGYRSALVSIIPPNAPLSPHSKVQPDQCGKSPGKWTPEGWTGFPKWTEHETTDADVDRWIEHQANIGLRTRDFPFIDVDVEAENVAAVIVQVLESCYGPKLLRRYGRAPRVAIPFRTDEPFRKVVYTLRDAGGHEGGKVEISGDGNQMVIHGTHPKTGQPYRWQDGEIVGGVEVLACHDPATLPNLTARDVPALADAIALAVQPLGLTLEQRAAPATTDAQGVDQVSLRAPSLVAVREVVEAIPNDFEDRSDYLKVLRAIRAAAGEDNYNAGLDVAQDWAARWEGGNDPAVVARDFNSLRAPHQLGWGYLLSLAQRAGYNAAVWDFEIDPNARASTLPIPPADRGFTDMGNAGRFARRYRDSLCYVTGGWLKWDGQRWAPVDAVRVERLAKEVPREMYVEASRIADDAKRNRLLRWAIKSETAERIGAMVKLARGELARDIDDFDKDPYALTVQNGILDLRTAQLRKATAEDPVRIIAGTVFDPTAIAPLWESVIAITFDNKSELIDYFQRLCGYILTGDTKEQILAFLYGLGANGKTTILEVLRAVLGEYSVQAPFSQFAAGAKSGSGGASPEIVRLRGKRAVMASESRRGARLDETQIKSLTGGDTVVGRELYKPHQEFRPEFKLLGAVNHKPQLPGDDPAVWRRVHLVPFLVSIPADSRDPDLPAKLRRELPGILAWMVRGCLRWQQEGLNPPSAVVQATESYRAEMDDVARFIRERCELNALAEVGASELYDAFCAWRAEDDESSGLPLSQREFGQRVRAYDPGRIITRKSSKTKYVGIRVCASVSAEPLNDPAQTEDAA